MVTLAVLKKYLYPIVFSFIYITGFSIYYLSIGDWEFLWYVGVMLFFLGLIVGTVKYTQLSLTAVWGLCFWGFLHMAGGGVKVGEGVLYAYKIWPLLDLGGEFYILKFDQVVHIFGFAVATLVMYEVVKSRWQGSIGLLVFIAVLSSMGLGVINEIVEFLAVVVFADTGVGGYYNTLLDLVFNTVGAIIVGVYLYCRRKASET
ncbi:MAG: DUF2238 domain-containing protein [Candidatus Paceibacterota bacterium]